MNRGALKFTACFLATGIAFTGTGTSVLAAKNEPLAGIGSAEYDTEDSDSQKSVKEIMDEIQAERSNSGAETVEGTVDDGTGNSGAADTAESQAEDTSLNGTLAFAQCDEYINIRTSAGTDGEVVGKIYNNGSATILGKVGDWYEVQTGNVTGYVNADYFAVGSEADAIAQQVAYNVATVHPDALMVRAEPDEDSESVGVARNSDQLEVVAYEGDWMKVALGGDTYGYVNAYYVDYDTYYATGETLEEEQERLDEQWLAYLDEQKQAEEAYEAQLAAEREAGADNTGYEETSSSDTVYTGDDYGEPAPADYYEEPAAEEQTWSDGGASDAQAVADAAYQNYLDAQATADAATQQADEQYVQDTAAAAQAAYQEFVNAQNAADAAAAGADYTGSEGTSSSDTGYTDDYYEEPAPADYYEEQTWSDGGASEAQSAADAAYQNYLDAQATADAATQQADEQYVYDTAQAAQAAYQEYVNAQNAADAAAAGADYTGSEGTSSTDTGYTDNYYEEPAPADYYEEQTWSDGGASEAQSAADTAYQNYLDAQATADAATQQADEQYVYDTAQAAQAAYQEYVNAQNAADAAAAGTDYTETPVEDTGYTEDYYEEPVQEEQNWSEEEYEEPEAQYTENYTSGGGQAIVDYALQFVGNPYVWGGTSLTNGADCSGFTQSVFANFGIGIPRTAAAQSGSGTPVDLGSIQPGDLLFYEGGSGIGHVSIYMGGGQVVHASNSSTGIIVSDYGYRTPVSARRYW